jgi:RNA polymerase sigma factor (sigma-70 family)
MRRAGISDTRRPRADEARKSRRRARATGLETDARSGVILGWSLNELGDPDRARAIDLIISLSARATPIAVIEPIATRLVPWWPAFAGRVAKAGGRVDEWKFDAALRRPWPIWTKPRASSGNRSARGPRCSAYPRFMSQAEQALPDALRAGDPQAFEDLVRRNTPRLLSVTRRILKNDDEAAEAVQQAFVAAFKSREQFHGQSQPSTWLHRIAVNKALDLMRARERRHEESIDELLPHFLPGRPSQRAIRGVARADRGANRPRPPGGVDQRGDRPPSGHVSNRPASARYRRMSTDETAEALGDHAERREASPAPGEDGAANTPRRVA